MSRFYVAITLILGILMVQSAVLAHGADRGEGLQLAEALKIGTVECDTLSDAQFENMGDYYMEQMMGESHEQMDAMMETMMGETGLTQMHVAMGKRMSGCDTGAPMPAQMMSGMGGMMQMLAPSQTEGFGTGMGGGMMDQGISGGGMMNTTQGAGMLGSMMGSFYPPGFVALWYVVGVLGAVALILVIVKYLRELLK